MQIAMLLMRQTFVMFVIIAVLSIVVFYLMRDRNERRAS